MSNLITLTQRELKSLWYSPIGASVGALFLLLQGWVFWLLLAVLNDPRVDPSWTMAQFYFGGTFFYWLAALITAPLLTMRTFSEERRSGTLEVLLTTPVTNTQVVLAKFFGAWLFYNILWAATVVFFLLLGRIASFDWGPILTGYIGTWLLGAVLMAIGVFASSLTRNQVVAALISFVLLVLLFSFGIMDALIHDAESRKLIRYFSLSDHLSSFGKGILDTRPIVFYLSLTAIFLFLTGRVVGSPRWRS